MASVKKMHIALDRLAVMDYVPRRLMAAQSGLLVGLAGSGKAYGFS